MILLSRVINEFEERFLDRYKDSVLPGHLKALSAIAQRRRLRRVGTVQNRTWSAYAGAVHQP